MVATFVGVAGDYWADGVGFPVEVLRILIRAVGSSVYGAALLRGGIVPAWCGWMLVACGPGAFVSLFLVGHIPSGPTIPIAVASVVLGFRLALGSR